MLEFKIFLLFKIRKNIYTSGERLLGIIYVFLNHYLSFIVIVII